MKTKSIFFVLFAVFFSLSAISQTTGGSTGTGSNNGSVSGGGKKTTARHSAHRTSNKHKKHRTGAQAPVVTMPNRTSQTTKNPTDLSNSGSSNGTMPTNNDPGKETTSDKGKTGPANGTVKKPRRK